MSKTKYALLPAAAVLLAAFSLSAQIKLASVSGSPGFLDETANVAFTRDGATGYVSNPGSGAVLKFRVATGEVVASAESAAGIGPMTLSPDERTLAVLGIADQTIYLINTAEMKVRHTLQVDRSAFSRFTNMVFSPDSWYLFIANPARNLLVVFDVQAGIFSRYIEVGINPNVLSVIPGGNGQFFAVLCSGKKASDLESFFIVDALNFRVLDYRTLPVTNTDPVNNFAFTINGSHMFIPIFNESRMVVYDLKTRVLASRAVDGKEPSRAFASPDGRWMAVTCAASDSVSVYPLPAAVNDWRVDLPGVDITSETSLAFSSDGHTLFIPDGEHQVLQYDLFLQTFRDPILTGLDPVAVSIDVVSATLASIDVGSNEVSLITLNPTATYLPDLIQSADEYAGLAIANFTEENVNVALVAKDNSGVLLPGASNPRILTVAPNQQISKVLAEIFGFNPTERLEGYIESYALTGGVTTLYLRGTISQTQLDGFFADAQVSKLLGFTRITEGVPRFGLPTSTDIILLNVGGSPADLTYRVFADTPEGPGRLIGNVQSRLLPHHRLRSRLQDMVPLGRYPLEKLYLEVTSNVELKGLSIVRIGDSTAMVPATPRGLPDVDFLAVQYASGGAGVLNTPIYSDLSLSNSTASPITVTAVVTDDKGEVIPEDAEPFVRTLSPYETITGDAHELLGFPDPLEDPTLYQGTMRITADARGLIADLLYGDARNGAFLTTGDLKSAAGREFALGHMAEGRFGAPPKGIYTGIAVYNPNPNFSDLRIEAFTPDNKAIGKTFILMPDHSRLSKTIGQILPAVTQQNGGTIRITSTLPVYIFEVFGGTDGEFLVAVPPLRIAP